MDDISLQVFVESLRKHARKGQIGFILYELLTDAGFDDEEIQLITTETQALAVESETMH